MLKFKAILIINKWVGLNFMGIPIFIDCKRYVQSPPDEFEKFLRVFVRTFNRIRNNGEQIQCKQVELVINECKFSEYHDFTG